MCSGGENRLSHGIAVLIAKNKRRPPLASETPILDETAKKGKPHSREDYDTPPHAGRFGHQYHPNDREYPFLHISQETPHAVHIAHFALLTHPLQLVSYASIGNTRLAPYKSNGANAQA
jgi:hypothetical protein